MPTFFDTMYNYNIIFFHMLKIVVEKYKVPICVFPHLKIWGGTKRYSSPPT